jgi:beta propeller repeat protein
VVRRGFLLAALLAFSLCARGAAAGPAPPSSRYAPGVVLVRLREGADVADALAALAHRVALREAHPLFGPGEVAPRARRRPAATLAALPDARRVYRLRVAPGVDAARAAALYAADPRVAWAQPDYLMEADLVPNDPYFGSAGSWGQPYADLWGLARIRAPEAWDYTQGEGAVVAVVDSGIDATHPDIAENLWVNPGEDLDGDGRATAADRNGIDDDGNGFVDDLIGFDFENSVDADGDGRYDGPQDRNDADPTDDNGHGTHVAGTIAAVGNNGIGIVGVAPRARVMALKGFPASGPGRSSVLARAIVYAAANGADAINASWSCAERCPENPVIDEAVARAHALGTVFVTSAGNRADDVVFYSPEKLRTAITVAASNEDDSHADFSNTGFLLDVAAPGAGRPRFEDPFAVQAILSLLAAGAPELWSAGLRVGTGYVRQAGTSMSAPHVAGVVALARSLHPDATPEEIRALLRATARDVGAPGHDRLFGAGIVDALAAVTRSAPRVRGVLAEPAPGAIVDARAGRVELRGSADGEDFAGYALAFGHGVDPSVWQGIPAASAAAVSDGLLATWDVDALGDGAYVVRLDVASASGEQVHEFLPLSLERNRPFPISPAGVPAYAPDVSGDLVVWESPAGGEEGSPSPDRDVLAADLRSGREIAVAVAPGDQRMARISGRRVVFVDRAREPGGEIATCSLERKGDRCDPVVLAAGPAQRSQPVVSGERVYWTEEGVIQLCDLGDRPGRSRAAGCTPRRVAPRPNPQQELAVGGLRLVWRESNPRFSLWSCLLSPASDACSVQLVDDDAPVQQTPAVSGDLFAWEQFGAWPGLGFGSQVQVCRLDPASGACPRIGVGTPSTATPTPDVAGDTVVWSGRAGDEAPAIFFCEYDAATRSCPAQRLTGSAAGQQSPVLSGRRVVFEDARDGPSRIYGFDLPDLAVRGARRVREGGQLHIEVAGVDPRGEPMALAATLPGGESVESLGMRFVPRGRNAAVLLWRPERGAAGRYTVLLRGTTAGRLVTRETLEIEVLEETHARIYSASREEAP